MGNYENLKQSITEVIRTNGNQEITGAVLQSTLLTIISTVGANATFAGIATPATNPGTPDGPVFYLASESGTYSNFGGIELQDGLSVLMWNGSWSSQQIFGIDDEPTAGSDNLVKSGGAYAEITDLDLKVDSTRVDLVSEILRKQNNPISDNNNHTLSICDEKGNIIAHIQSGVDIDSFGNIITKLFDSSHTISDNKGGYTIKNKNGDIVFKVSNKSTLLNDVFSNDKNICVTDAEGNIIAKISKNGTETTNAKTNNIFSYDKLIICDEKGNISLSIDKETTQLNKLKAKYLQVNKIDILDNNDKSVPTIGIDDKFETDFVGVYMYGQSLGNGCYSGNVVSTVCPYKNLFSFKGGVRTYDSFYLNHSRHTWINRKGDVKYGELIDYKNTLSDIDIAAINDSYSELIPLVQKIQMYSPYTNEIYPDISYKANNKGGTYMQHVAGEVPMSGILEVFDMLLIDEDKYNIDNKMLNFIGGCPDYGSATFLSMLPLDCGGITQGPTQMQETETVPDINWFEMLSLDVYKAKEYCDSIGKTYSVSALFYYHEGDFDETSIMISKSARLRLFTRINDRIKEITGQENDVIFIMHQSHMSLTHNKIDMQLGLETEPNVYTSEQEIRLKNAFDAVKPDGGVSLYDTPEYDKNKIYLGQPIYGYKYADSIHLTSEYSKRHGAAMGYVYKRVVVDGKDWKPIHPLSHKVSQVVIDGVSYYKTSVKFHLDVAPLILDDNAINGTQTSVTATNRGDKYGFIFANQDGTLHGKDGNNEDFIKKIEVVKGNTINFYTIDNTVGMNLHYAIDFTKAENSYLDGNARVNRPIGNLRDSRGTYYKVHINDKIGDVPIDNWCPSFIYNIN